MLAKLADGIPITELPSGFTPWRMMASSSEIVRLLSARVRLGATIRSSKPPGRPRQIVLFVIVAWFLLITRDDNNDLRYYNFVIINFRNEDSRKLFERRHSKRLPGTIQRTAHRKLLQLHAATRIGTLRIPPSNRLERLNV